MIKPCPFCGGKSAIRRSAIAPITVIQCEACTALFSVIKAGSSRTPGHKELTIKTWNSRVNIAGIETAKNIKKEGAEHEE